MTLASGNPENIDTSVMQMTTSYNAQGEVFKQTSLSGTGTVVNQTEDVYNGLGQLTRRIPVRQRHRQRGHHARSSIWLQQPVSGSRLASMTYPNGRVLDYVYNSGLDSDIGRIGAIADDGGSDAGTDASYSYLGVGTIVGQTDDNGTVETITLDQFGRTAEIKYVNSSSVTTDDFQYGYDQDGNVLYKANGVLTTLSQLYTYDDLNRLTSSTQGTLNGTDTAITGTPTASQEWTYDALGNQTEVDTNGTTEDNSTNSQNELTSYNGTSQSFDNDSNTLIDATTGNHYVYDAWNRLVSVTDGTNTIASYS